jgi:hypothetical protein
MSSGGFDDQASETGSFGRQGPYGPPDWQQPRHTNSLAIAALCCGIAQLIAGPLAGIPAIVLGFVSVGQIQRTGEDGRGMAITGLILGIVGLMFFVLVLVFAIGILSEAR